MNQIRIIYMGTPDFSVLPLKKLCEKYNIIAVVTQPDKEVGRKREIRYSKVKEFALEHNIKIIQPNNIKTEYQEILDLKPDLIITCAYGQILPTKLLNYPKYKCINIHASLLPLLRGGAPIHRAIIEGHKKTGVTIMYMDEKMDSGDILFQKSINIEIDDNVDTLFNKLSVLGSEMIIDFLPKFFNNNFNVIKQDESKVTYAYNITKEDEKIDFNDTSINIYNKIRGLNSWPVGYSILDNKKIKIYNSRISNTSKKGIPGEIINIYKDSIGVKTIDGEVQLTEIQIEGKKRMLVSSYLNGLKNNNELIGKIFK